MQFLLAIIIAGTIAFISDMADEMEMGVSPLTVPTGTVKGLTPSIPIPSQHDLDVAIARFHIQIPADGRWPVYRASLADRGATHKPSILGPTVIEIGPTAFASWPMLASTLAHEAEVHGHQNFLWIGLLDIVGLDGTGFAERQAYIYEITSARRFGMPPVDQERIARTMAYFYPEKDRNELAAVMHRLIRGPNRAIGGMELGSTAAETSSINH